jgi:hypothetical protein
VHCCSTLPLDDAKVCTAKAKRHTLLHRICHSVSSLHTRSWRATQHAQSFTTDFIVMYRQMNGRFPYPFMNTKRMDNIWGVLVVAVVSVAIMQLLFELGRLVARISDRALYKKTGSFKDLYKQN